MTPSKMPYEKPSLQTVDARALSEAVGPVQALASGSGAGSPGPNSMPPMTGQVTGRKLNR
jgi:hypothetical protein